MIYSILLDAIEGNPVFHVLANEVEQFGDYTVIIDGIEIIVKDRIIDIILETNDLDD